MHGYLAMVHMPSHAATRHLRVFVLLSVRTFAPSSSSPTAEAVRFVPGCSMLQTLPKATRWLGRSSPQQQGPSLKCGNLP